MSFEISLSPGSHKAGGDRSGLHNYIGPVLAFDVNAIYAFCIQSESTLHAREDGMMNHYGGLDSESKEEQYILEPDLAHQWGFHEELHMPHSDEVAQSRGGLWGPHILLAEDDGEMRTLLASLLREANYKVTECSNGIKLLHHLGTLVLPLQSTHYDLVITDIRMPGPTGLEVLEGIQEHEDFPPFIIMTAFGDDCDYARAKAFGAIDIFEKPFAPEELLRALEKYFKNWE